MDHHTEPLEKSYHLGKQLRWIYINVDTWKPEVDNQGGQKPQEENDDLPY